MHGSYVKLNSSFNGEALESAFVSEAKTFTKYTNRLKSLSKPESTLDKLKKSYLPHALNMRRKSSEESVTSNKGSKESDVSKRDTIRGKELVRLASKTAELRRNSNEEYKDNQAKVSIQKQTTR